MAAEVGAVCSVDGIDPSETPGWHLVDHPQPQRVSLPV
jgi:hypothetical protein